MPRTPDPLIAERDAKIVEVFLSNKNQNLTELGEQFGTTYNNVHRILTRAGVWDRSERDHEINSRRKRMKFSELRSPNVWFTAIGHKIWYWRSHRPDSAEELSRNDLARMLGMSTPRVTQIELGIALDLTLMEICKIAKCLGTTPEDLITPQNPVAPASSSSTPVITSRRPHSGTEFGLMPLTRRQG